MAKRVVAGSPQPEAFGMGLTPSRGREPVFWSAVRLGQAPAPMLAQLEPRLPVGPSWRYEPKLDGFRGLLWRRAGGQVQLLSRNARDVGAWFPELVRAADVLPLET